MASTAPLASVNIRSFNSEVDANLVAAGSGVMKAVTVPLVTGRPELILTLTEQGKLSPTVTSEGGYVVISMMAGILDTSISLLTEVY